MRLPIFMGWRNRFKTAILALTALIVSIAPALTLKGWVYLSGAVTVLVLLVALWDVLDLRTVYRDWMAWRHERRTIDAMLSARRQRRVRMLR